MDIENKISTKILDCAFAVHRNLGPGLLESAYQVALEAELEERSIPYKAQYPIPMEYKNRSLETAYRLDLFVMDKVIIECKATDHLSDIHMAQVLTYLKLTGCRLGILLNFNVKWMKRGIRRVIL